MAVRLACIVPFCRRTVAQAGRFANATEWICGDHWRGVPRITKRLYTRARRRCRPEVAYRIWRRARREALDGAFALSTPEAERG